MTDGYSRSPWLLKGALIEFSERLIGPVPHIILFQYNPETLTRSLGVWQPPREDGEDGEGEASEPATAQPKDPSETFSLSLELDAADALEQPEKHPIAFVSGVADRIAALEMLLYPKKDGLFGTLFQSPAASLACAAGAGESEEIPRLTVPIVIFAWGLGRVVPVRVTSFQVEEQAFSPILYPIRARVSVGLKVMTPEDLCEGYEDDYSRTVAEWAFRVYRKEKQVLATANIANNVESILGMLPF